MQLDLSDIERRLAGTALQGAALHEVDLPEDGRYTWVVEGWSGNLVDTWQVAHDALASIALYPVAVTVWGEDDWLSGDLFSRFFYGDADDTAPERVIARGRQLSVRDALDRFAYPSDWAADHWEEVVENHLDVTKADFGKAPGPELLAGIARGDEIELERRLLGWEEQRRPTVRREENESFDWFEPAGQRIGLVLLPIRDPSEAAAYLSFYGAEGAGGHEALFRLMNEWHAGHGARLVANWGTMLQFVVSAPPETLEAAFALAAQHVAVAPCTTSLPGETVRGLARHLWRGDRWFLHERP